MKKATRRILSLMLSVAVMLSAMVFAFPAAAETYDADAAFMAGKYGIFLHYLASKNSDGTTEGWNRSVNSFNVNALAKTAHNVGASWVTLTLTQNDGKYCIPMPELEELTGIADLGTDRDLVNDLYTALSAYGIKLMLYWIPGAPAGTDETATTVAAKLGATERTGAQKDGDWALNDGTVANMTAIMRAVSERYGDKITGWWIDGCYDGETNFTAAYATEEAAALRAGNPDALVAFNAGTRYGDCRFPVESYTAGETCHYLRVNDDPFTNYSASGQYSENGYQRHFLTFLGDNWGKSNCIYDTDTLVRHCYDNILSKGAAITFDVGVASDGTIAPEQVNQIAALDQYVHQSLELALDFEDGYNPYMWTDNVTADYNSSASTEYSALVSGADALNGSYSLRVMPPVTNTGRTDIVAGTGTAKQNISFKGNPSFSKTDFSGCTGIMLRLKIDNDTSGSSHNIKLNVMQGSLPVTRLSRGAFAFDTAGNKLSVSGGSSNTALPAGFDGFVFFPFETAQSDHVTDPGRYDDYDNYPEILADFSRDFKMSIILNDASWSGQTVLLDDIRFYTGTEQSTLCDMLRGLGYSSVVYKTQPDAYTFPIDFEDCQTPLTKVNTTGNLRTRTDESAAWTWKAYYNLDGSAALTNDADRVLSGSLSYAIRTAGVPAETATEKYDNARVDTNYFTVSGVAALATSAITSADYAYLKLRLKAPVTADGSSLEMLVGIKQNGTDYGNLGQGAIGYDMQYRSVSAVSQGQYGGHGASFYVPSGFDGTVYLPIYNLRKSWKGVYANADVAKPDLTQNFQMYFSFISSNWVGAEILLDDIDVVYPSNGLPMNFEEACDLKIPSLNNIYSGAEHQGDTASVTLARGGEALHGSTSLRLSIPTANNNSRTETDYVTVAGNQNYTADDLTAVTGLWLRMKVTEPEGYTGGEHTFALTALQGSKISRRFKSYVVLYDNTGKRLEYNRGGNDPQGFKIPAGFDGFVFMPFVGQYSFRDWHGFGSNPDNFADFAQDWRLSLYFSDSSWNGSTVLVDDIAYFSSYAEWDDAGQLSDMDADAWETMRAAGYAITRNPQPESYSIPLDFENGEIPFASVKSYYSGNGSYPTVTENQDITAAADALHGNASFKLHVPVSGSYTAESGYTFIRAESSQAAFDGIAEISSEKLASVNAGYAYLKLRMKLPATADGSAYRVFFGFNQNGNDYTTVLKGGYGYTVGGRYVAISTEDLYTLIPSGFDGTLYIPVKNRMTFLNSNQQSRGTTENAVDFGESFTMWLSLYGANWADTTMLLDDMEMEYTVPGDVNGDGRADTDDLDTLRRELLTGSGSYRLLYDINDDSVVDIRDLVRLDELLRA